MNFKSRQDVWSHINDVYSTIMASPDASSLIPANKGVIVTTKITDLQLEYTEKIGLGKWELFEGTSSDTDITLEMNSETHYGIQMGIINPMQAVVKKTLKIHGIPFKLLRGQKVNDRFKEVYQKKIENQIAS